VNPFFYQPTESPSSLKYSMLSGHLTNDFRQQSSALKEESIEREMERVCEGLRTPRFRHLSEDAIGKGLCTLFALASLSSGHKSGWAHLTALARSPKVHFLPFSASGYVDFVLSQRLSPGRSDRPPIRRRITLADSRTHEFGGFANTPANMADDPCH